MNLRALLAAAVFLPAGASFAQTTCVVEGFDRTCEGTTLTFCDATDDAGAAQPPVTNTFDCSTNGTGVGCGDQNCTGDGCGDLSTCVGTGEASSCIGESVFYDADTENDQLFLAITCAAGFACKTVVTGDGTALEDSCTANTEVCTGASARCDGQVGVTCYAGGEAATAFLLNSPTLQDCSTFPAGSTCAVNEDTPGSPFAFCDVPAPAEGEGEGEGAEGEGEAAEGEGEDGDGNNRDDEPAEPAPSNGLAGCLNASGTLPVFGPLALVLVALRRRRR